ncbi:MAG: phosphoadenosine phosphosulfate reductase [Boseongicola sp.]|nr:phosphoadenosine phosphosulfate reductase [Boseongicola sp.]NNL17854.1 phosphoadenosine phosphosulfate reductase [Boseongicola sp.]
MVAGAALSDDLTDTQWLVQLEDIGEEEGYFSPLGDNHAAVFVDRSQDVLFVSFETLAGARAVSETGLPLGFDVCESRGWSHLTLLAFKDTWYRSHFVYGYFDRLVDEGFFEDFDKVIFYGAGMCGYAAAAFSVVAPGATVIAISPQATLARDLTEWDTRFEGTRRMDFTSRYGFAPDMLEAADAAYIIYDPDEVEDAMHAALFRGPNIFKHRYRRGRSGAIDSDLRTMGLISRLCEIAVNGYLTPVQLARKMRSRRRHMPYLRALLARVIAEDRPHLTARLCRAVLADRPIPRFRHHLDAAEARLKEQERPLSNQATEADSNAG